MLTFLAIFIAIELIVSAAFAFISVIEIQRAAGDYAFMIFIVPLGTLALIISVVTALIARRYPALPSGLRKTAWAVPLIVAGGLGYAWYIVQQALS